MTAGGSRVLDALTRVYATVYRLGDLDAAGFAAVNELATAIGVDVGQHVQPPPSPAVIDFAAARVRILARRRPETTEVL
jgi:hypothetical protein